MQSLEKTLDDLFKKVPQQLPESARKALAQSLPWITLVAGVLSLYFAWQVYQWTSFFDSSIAAFGYSISPVVGMYGPMLWVSLIILVIQAVLFLVAFPALRTGKKRGWDLLFWGALANVVYAVVNNLFSGYANVGQLLFMLLGSAFGLYLLFQVRGYFVGAGTATSAPRKASVESDKKQ